MSLAEAEKELGNIMNCLQYYYEITKTKNDFNLWLKMAKIA